MHPSIPQAADRFRSRKGCCEADNGLGCPRERACRWRSYRLAGAPRATPVPDPHTWTGCALRPHIQRPGLADDVRVDLFVAVEVLPAVLAEPHDGPLRRLRDAGRAAPEASLLQRQLTELDAVLVGYLGHDRPPAAPYGHWRTTTFVAGLRSTGLVALLVLDRFMNGRRS